MNKIDKKGEVSKKRLAFCRKTWYNVGGYLYDLSKIHEKTENRRVGRRLCARPLMRKEQSMVEETPEFFGARRFRLKSGYAVRAFMDEYLVIPVASPEKGDAKMAVLNPVGEFIWTRLGSFCTFEELVTAVTEEFEVSAEVASEDIRDFLRELQKHGFLENDMEETQHDIE